MKISRVLMNSPPVGNFHPMDFDCSPALAVQPKRTDFGSRGGHADDQAVRVRIKCLLDICLGGYGGRVGVRVIDRNELFGAGVHCAERIDEHLGIHIELTYRIGSYIWHVEVGCSSALPAAEEAACLQRIGGPTGRQHCIEHRFLYFEQRHRV